MQNFYLQFFYAITLIKYRGFVDLDYMPHAYTVVSVDITIYRLFLLLLIVADNLYQSVAFQLKKGRKTLTCFNCNKEWDFQDTCEKAQMSMDEKIFWGKKISLNSLNDECPKCRYFCERIESNNDRAVCLKCSKGGNSFEFCWKCKMKWTGSHKCDSKEEMQRMLNNCGTKIMPMSLIPNVPKLRLCPSCGALIEHIDRCKETPCHRCKKSFCFVCLTMCDKGLKCSSYNRACTVAPVQIAK